MELNENFEDSISINISFKGKIEKVQCNYDMNFEEIINIFLKKFKKMKFPLDKIIIMVNEKQCFLEENLEAYKEDIKNNSIFYLKYKKNVENEPNEPEEVNPSEDIENEDIQKDINIVKYEVPLLKANKIKRDYEMVISRINKPIMIKEINNFDFEINIKFIKTYKNIFKQKCNSKLFGLLKLCLLKEISLIKDFNKNHNLPDYISNIMTILKRGQIECNNIKEDILKILKKIKGGNIINFSNYVDDLISEADINKYLISQLDENDKNEINYIRNCLGKYVEYVKQFEQEFERAKRDSVFEYSIISLEIIEREDLINFEKNRKKYKNKVDRVLFHGTTYESIANILTDLFRKSSFVQHGKGVYFTEDIDSCWIYGSENKNNNYNRNLNIPKVGEYFSFIASAIYYDKKGFKRVYDNKYNPKKNEINFAYADMKSLETILDEVPDKTKFYGTEFVINNSGQICPFMSLKLKRDEYCVIWRDNNFSSKPVYGNEIY